MLLRVMVELVIVSAARYIDSAAVPGGVAADGAIRGNHRARDVGLPDAAAPDRCRPNCHQACCR